MAPASRSRVTTLASKSGFQSESALAPAVVRTPRVAKLSLMEIGMP